MRTQKKNSKGFTLITTLILLFLLSAVSIGLLMMVNTEAKVGSQDVQNNYTFHAAEGGIEAMTSALANQLAGSLNPTGTQIQALATSPGPPTIPGITFPNPGGAYPNGGYTYTPTVCTGVGAPTSTCTAAGNLVVTPSSIASGPYAGLNALVSDVQLQATAQGLLGDEVSMNRTVEIALIPVFQFGMFSDSDLSFYAGANFSFGGRVHTNGDLYLAEGSGASLTFQNKISAYGNVIRNQMANGVVLGASGDTHTGPVYIPTSSGGCTGVTPPVASCASFTYSPNDGSTLAGPSTAAGNQNSTWQTVSETNFAGYIIDGDYGSTTYGTGATALTLPFMAGTSSTTTTMPPTVPQQYEILRRPPLTGDLSNVAPSRLYNEAQIRVLLSDDPGELPCGNPSTPPDGVCGRTDAQNVRLANVSNNTLDYSHGVPQSSMATLSDGGYPSMYFATADTAVPDSEYWSSALTGVAPDWSWGPLYTFPLQTIYDAGTNVNAPYTGVGSPLSASNFAPYIIRDIGSGKAYGMKTSPMPAYLLVCDPPNGATTVTTFTNGEVSSYKTSSASTPPTCPDAGAYPYYSIYGFTAPGQTGTDPNLYLPYPYQSAQTSPTPSTVIPENTDATGYQSSWNLIDGYLRVEYEDASGNYHPVTQEWLSLGFGRGVQPPTTAGGNAVNPTAILLLQQLADRNGDGTVDAAGSPPTWTGPVKSGSGATAKYTYTLVPSKPPEVVVDSSSNSYVFGDSKLSGANQSPTQYNWYPINFYDAREGDVREDTVGDMTCTPNGIMNAVELDVGNLKRWLSGAIGTSGPNVNSQSQNGYILYFSDRRGMLKNPNGTPGGVATAANPIRTGDSGLEDAVNSNVTTGQPDGALDANSPGKNFSDEDVNMNGVLDNYGAQNLALGFGFNSLLPVPATGVAGNTDYTAAAVLNTAIWKYVNPGGVNGDGQNPPAAPNEPNPYVTGHRIASCTIAQNNWVSGARHALKLVDGTLGNVPLAPGGGGGFTVGSENPVYIFGDYNSNSGDSTWASNGTGADQAGEAASGIIADSVTLLSNNWQDWNSILLAPTTYTNRTATNTYYRVAISAGKNINFTYPTTCSSIAAPLQCTTDYGTDGGVHNFLRFLENWGCCTLAYKGSIASLYYSTYNTGTYKSAAVYNPPARNYFFDTDFNQLSGLPPGTPMFRDIDNLSYRQSFNPCTVGGNDRCSN